LSVELYSALQKAGHQLEAQYATLYGHKQRWQMTQNAVQFYRTAQAVTDAESKKLVSLMKEKLGEQHPIISEIANA
jgi:hypothetical protein